VKGVERWQRQGERQARQRATREIFPQWNPASASTSKAYSRMKFGGGRVQLFAGIEWGGQAVLISFVAFSILPVAFSDSLPALQVVTQRGSEW